MGPEDDVRAALRHRLVVGSIGPVMNDALNAEGISPDVIPRHPKMWSLAKAAAEESSSVADRKTFPRVL
jgi:uroporphyrinogen-III synthase